MKYEDAIKIKNTNKHLIGTISNKGFTIDEIIIVPSKEESRNRFFSLYLAGQSPDFAIEMYKGEDMLVWAIDRKYLYESNKI